MTDEYHYSAFRVGRPTRTVEVQAPDGSTTIEEGTLTAELVDDDALRLALEDGGWTAHYIGPDGGIGFVIDDDNPGGVAVRYELIGVIELPEPMPEDAAEAWIDDNEHRLREFEGCDPLEERIDDDDELIQSDTIAADVLEDVR